MTNDQILAEGLRMIYNALNEGVDISLTDINNMIEQVKNGQGVVVGRNEDLKPSNKPLWKSYSDLAFGAAMDATRLRMIIQKLEATVELMNAQEKYFAEMSELERENSSCFGFDLSI